MDSDEGGGMSFVTQWFDAKHKLPKRIGHYQYRYGGARFTFTAHWDGLRFTIADASFFDGNFINFERGDQWRGLADEPEAA